MKIEPFLSKPDANALQSIKYGTWNIYLGGKWVLLHGKNLICVIGNYSNIFPCEIGPRLPLSSRKCPRVTGFNEWSGKCFVVQWTEITWKLENTFHRHFCRAKTATKRSRERGKVLRVEWWNSLKQMPNKMTFSLPFHSYLSVCRFYFFPVSLFERKVLCEL